MGQFATQRAYLEQVLKARPDPTSRASQVPRELAAGLPMEAARALLFLGPEVDGVPWQGAPAGSACIAAALRLFARLLPSKVDEDACAHFCVGISRPLHGQGFPSCSVSAAEAFEAEASTWGFNTRRVPSAANSLKAMVRNRPVACCVLLKAYIGVLEDPETGEELEQEVGEHCLLLVGGDLLGPSYVAFDPFGLRGGEVSHWSAHGLEAASPAAWVELSPRLS